MTVIGIVFALTMEKVKDSHHNFTLISFKDRQEDAVAEARQQADFLALAAHEVDTGDDLKVMYQMEGNTRLLPHTKVILKVKAMSVAEALNQILAQAKRK